MRTPSSARTTSQQATTTSNGIRGMRTSCDDCGSQKRKCDGGMPCSRCVRVGRECNYSRRRTRHNHQSTPRRQPRRPRGEVSQSSAPGAARAHGMLSIKRCRLSASPATGLVGMRENTFLSDFFGCIGFFPLTKESNIRETLVEIMALPAAAEQPSSSMLHWVGQGELPTIGTEDSELPTEPSTCIFWCAVALGALVQGNPVESVANYTQLARDSLERFSGPAKVEVAKAWTILACLYGFMGDVAHYHEYMDLASSFLTTSIKQGSAHLLPVGFAEYVGHRQADRVCGGDLSNPVAIESICAIQEDAPKIDVVAGERGVYRYVTLASLAFGKQFFTKACEKNAAVCGGYGEDTSFEDGNGNSDGGRSDRTGLPATFVADAMATALEGTIIELDVLEEILERPTISGGIGGLKVNGILFLQHAVMGDHCHTLEKISRCVEIYERYPGLCRCTFVWFHLPHTILAVLVGINDTRARGLYNRLVAVYNHYSPPGSLSVPPLREWKGVSSFCENPQCRALEGVIANEALSAPSIPRGLERQYLEHGESRDFDHLNQSGVVSAGISSHDVNGSTSVGPSHGRIELDTSTSAFHGDQEPAQHMDFHARSAPCLYHPHRESQVSLNTEVTSSGTRMVHGSGDTDGFGPPGTSLMLPRSSETRTPTFHAEDDGIAAADWVDITHAMLDSTDCQHTTFE